MIMEILLMPLAIMTFFNPEGLAFLTISFYIATFGIIPIAYISAVLQVFHTRKKDSTSILSKIAYVVTIISLIMEVSSTVLIIYECITGIIGIMETGFIFNLL